MQFSVLRGLLLARATMLFVVVLFFCSQVNRNVFALSVEEYSRAEILSRSAQIFVGTVLAAKSDWSDENQQMIDTRYSVRVEEVVDNQRGGKITLGQITELAFKGGTVGEESIDIPGVPRFKPGDCAVFFLDETTGGGLSPLVGVHQGAYSVIGEKEKVVVPFTHDGCCNARLKSVGAVSDGGVPLPDFVRQIQQEIPAARPGKVTSMSDKDLAPVRPLVQTVDSQIMNAGKNRTTETTVPAALYRPVEPVEQTERTSRYAWLSWGNSYVRPGPITFNISPEWDSVYRQQAIAALSRWNQYAAAFEFTERLQPYGPRNQRNEIVWDTVANIKAKYHYDASDIYGVMIPYATNGRVTETDILIPIDSVNWAFDFQTSWDSLWNGGSQFRPYMLATLLHEVGHSFGREHTFNESQVDWLSTMDYGPSWFRSLRHIVYSDDASSVRARYAPRDIADAGLFLYYADANLQGNSKYKMSTVSAPYANAGDSVIIDKFVVENIGSQPMTDMRIQWQLRDVNSTHVYNGDYQLLDGTLPVGACWPFQNLRVAIPSSAPTGTYQIYARLDCAGENVGDAVDYNNTSMIPTQIHISNSLPDLTDAGDSLRNCSPVAAFPGQQVSVQCEIQNAGSSPSGNFNVAFYAFSTTNESVAYMLGYTSINSIKAGKTAPCRFEGNFPTSGKPGQYLVLWEIDYDGIIPETNETNNVAWKEDYVLEIAERSDLDLKFSAVNSTMKAKRNICQVTGDVTVTNVGTLSSPPCQMGVYCLDYAQGTLVKLQDIAIPALASNERVVLKPGTVAVQGKNMSARQVKQKKVKFHLAEDFSPSDKYLALIIDDLNTVPEGNEQNNLYTTPINAPGKKKNR